MDQRTSSRKSRNSTSSSPPRPHLNALSSLQALSPLATTRDNLPMGTFSDEITDSPLTAGGLSRSSSQRTLSRSLSGRERVFSDGGGGAGSGAPGLRRRSSGAENIPAGITTRLILVKAPSDKDATPLRQRSKSSSNLVPVSSFAALSDAPATSAAPRRSFAAASFSFTPTPAIGAAPGGSPVRRPSVSGTTTPGGGAGQTSSKALSPDEVLELARGLMSPVAAPTGAEAAKLQRRKSLTSLGGGGDKEPEPIALEPVEYVEMDDDTLLPFSDRPTQVAGLLANPVNETLVDLLSKSFPSGAVRSNWKEIPVTQWNWTEFERLLTKIGRKECPDYEWVLLAREAVRERSVALWEKLGVCLGCDPELMTAGDEDDSPASWAGLGLGDEGEYDPSLSRVFIEGLEPVDPLENEKAERALMLEFGRPVDALESPGIQWTDSMPTIGEEPNERGHNGGGAAPSAGNREVKDYFDENPGHRRHDSRDGPPSPSSVFASSFASTSASARGSPEKSRSKSFVGLQICTAPVSPFSTAGLSLSPTALAHDQQTQYDRGPGNPMFVSSFNTLSIGPNLGRKASMSAAGGGGAPVAPSFSPDALRGFGRSSDKFPGLTRKSSKAGMSESAITFVSEDPYAGRH